MSQASSIEWTDFTWNPTRGCSRVSEGCRHCYAEGIAARFSGPGKAYEGLAKRVDGEPRWTGEVRLVPSALDWPLRTRGHAEHFAQRHGRAPRVFVNSMSDLFHERLTNEEIAAVFGVMAASPWYIFQVLTKRPERAREWFAWATSEHRDIAPASECVHEATLAMGREGKPWWGDYPEKWPLPNVWLGASVEDQPTADQRIPHLLACPAALRFVSYEPALGPLPRLGYLLSICTECDHLRPEHYSGPELAPNGGACAVPGCRCGGMRPIDLIIVGGESGHGARPFDVAWARSTVEQCRAAGVACFIKQLGARARETQGSMANVPLWHGSQMHTSFLAGYGNPRGYRNRKGGEPAEWPEDLRVREMPQ